MRRIIFVSCFYDLWNIFPYRQAFQYWLSVQTKLQGVYFRPSTWWIQIVSACGKYCLDLPLVPKIKVWLWEGVGVSLESEQFQPAVRLCSYVTQEPCLLMHGSSLGSIQYRNTSVLSQVRPLFLQIHTNLNPSLYKFPLEPSNLYLQRYSIGSISYKSTIYMRTLQL